MLRDHSDSETLLPRTYRCLWTLAGKSTAASQGSTTEFKGPWKSPTSPLTLPDGIVCVADMGDCEQCVWYGDKKSWERLDVGKGMSPVSLAFHAKDNVLYVVCMTGHIIKAYEYHGKCKFVHRNSTSAPPQEYSEWMEAHDQPPPGDAMYLPTGVTVPVVDPSRIVVTDHRKRVLLLDARTLTVISTFESSIMHPYGVVATGTKVVIADRTESRLVVFNEADLVTRDKAARLCVTYVGLNGEPYGVTLCNDKLLVALKHTGSNSGSVAFLWSHNLVQITTTTLGHGNYPWGLSASYDLHNALVVMDVPSRCSIVGCERRNACLVDIPKAVGAYL